MTVGRSEELGELFAPRSVAVIGASNRTDSVGGSVFRNLLSNAFRGVVYPVNPRWKSVSGVRCYPDVASLPEAPDLAVIVVPAPSVPEVARALGRRGTQGLVVISSGFREIGPEGAAREAELVQIAHRYRMSIIGPNCFGILNTNGEVQLNATFSDTLPPKGSIAFVSQSGALCAGILRYGIAERIGFSRFLSVGNRAGVDENDLLGSFARDDATRVILLYVESLADGRRFLEVAREVTERKPVLVIKSGRSPAGERAARSHTGSLAQSGRDRLYDALFEQSGVLRMETIGDLFRAAKVFAAGRRLAGPQLAILTNSGGPGIVAADAATRRGLRVPPLSNGLRRRLARRLASTASVGNPVDMTADIQGRQYEVSLRALLGSREVDGAVVISTPTGTLNALEATEAILRGRGASPKPVVACLFGLSDISKEVGRLEEEGIPTFTFPEEAVGALSALARYGAWRSRPRTRVRSFRVDRAAARRVIRTARSAGASVLPEFQSRALLEAYGIRFPKVERVSDLPAALRVAETIGYPVALKVASPDISHKTDVGGVALHLADRSALAVAWAAMVRTLAARAPTARIAGFEVEAMVPGGHEVIVGAHQDPSFGPTVLFGMGGIYVEVLDDVTFRLAPMRTRSARAMVASVRASALLRGARGEPESDLNALYEVIERVSQLATELPEVAELDLNPMIVRSKGEGAVAVDARVALAPSSRSGPRASAGR
ncbi:MAG TPA: acetate--CoA ligase family protein [Thermoplasmata archaeon]|nr:acetate--CoA ligase family protein [Thermoplasmata archaeon]